MMYVSFTNGYTEPNTNIYKVQISWGLMSTDNYYYINCVCKKKI